jgi:hypothetical protein
MICLFVGFFLFHVALRTKVVSEGYQMDRFKTENKKLEARLYDLKAQKNSLMGPRGLEKKVKEFAARGTEFKNPDSSHVIFVQIEGKK